MEASALDALALSDPATLADAEQLKALHARCSAAGLCGPLADGLVGSLHSLFDVALKNNLVSLVLHYITEARRRASRSTVPSSPLPSPPPGLP